MTEYRMRCAIPGGNYQQIDVCLQQLADRGFESDRILRLADKDAGDCMQCLPDSGCAFTYLTAHGIEQAANFGCSGLQSINPYLQRHCVLLGTVQWGYRGEGLRRLIGARVKTFT